MAVIIRDMEMPDCCAECLCAKVYGCNIAGIFFEDEDAQWIFKNRPNWCPLEEIVRCKDCEYWDSASHRCDSHGLMEANGFCSEARIRANEL